MVQKVASTTHSATFLDLQTYFSLYHNVPEPECSSIIYYKVLHQRCDDRQTVLNIVNNICLELVIAKNKTCVAGGRSGYIPEH